MEDFHDVKFALPERFGIRCAASTVTLFTAVQNTYAVNVFARGESGKLQPNGLDRLRFSEGFLRMEVRKEITMELCALASLF